MVGVRLTGSGFAIRILGETGAHRYPFEPFTTDLERLTAERERTNPVTVTELFERIWLGFMPGLVGYLTRWSSSTSRNLSKVKYST